MAMNFTNKEIGNIMLCNHFHSILIFEFNIITMSHKAILVYKSFYILYLYALVFDSSPSLLSIILHSFKSFEGFKDSPNWSSKYKDIQSYTLFKIQTLLLESKFCTISKAKDLSHIKNHAQTLTSSLCDFLLPLILPCLNNFRAVF